MHLGLSDLATGLALVGFVGLFLYLLLMGCHMANHYTRLPGGEWTTWEKTVTSGSASVDKKRAA